MAPEAVVKWSAINVYEDEGDEGEEDQIQELQVEQALKVYTKALRLHSENKLDDAHDAYEELFQLEVLQDSGDKEEDTTLKPMPAQLRQLVYLANKNYGDFSMAKTKQEEEEGGYDDPYEVVKFALICFRDALKVDGGDPTLWRKTAELAHYLGYPQVARYCLESVLDSDASVVNYSEQRLAGQALKDVLEAKYDSVSLKDSRYTKFFNKKLAKHFEDLKQVYPWLHRGRQTVFVAGPLGTEWDNESKSGNVELQVKDRSWEAVGTALQNDLDKSLGIGEFGKDSKKKEDLQYKSWTRRTIIFPVDQSSSPEPSPSEEKSDALAEQAVTEDPDVAMIEPPTEPTHQRGNSNSRKRKPSATTLTDDTGRSRVSKRVRDRESLTATQAQVVVPTAPVREAMTKDEKLFEIAEECFAPFNVSLGTAEELKMHQDESRSADSKDQYIQDFKSILREWNNEKGDVVLYGERITSPDEMSLDLGFKDSKDSGTRQPILRGEGLSRWTKDVTSKSLGLLETMFEWLRALIFSKAYYTSRWSETLRHQVYRFFTVLENNIVAFLKLWEERLMKEGTDEIPVELLSGPVTLFELSLGMIAEHTGREELEKIKWRAIRWRNFAHNWRQCIDSDERQTMLAEYDMRFVWSCVILAKFEDKSNDYIMSCFEELTDVLQNSGSPKISLPNSFASPEVSIAQAEAEMSKLKTMDFFTDIMDSKTRADDPERIILSLEAILDPRPESMDDWDDAARARLEEIAGYMQKASVQFKLSLWDKLREAYEALETKDNLRILACRFRCLNMVISELTDEHYTTLDPESRQFYILRALYQYDKILEQTLEVALKDRWNVACLDQELLLSTLQSLAAFLRILHIYPFYEDGVLNKEYKAADSHSYRLFVVKLKEMLVRSWCFTYIIYKELLQQRRQEPSDKVDEPLARLLSVIHDELGSRSYCKLCDHVFLKMAQEEFLRFNLPAYHQDLVQCISCRFHLEIGRDTWTLYEHKTDVEPFTKKAATELLDFILDYARQRKVQQLPKLDVKATIEKMVEVFGVPEKMNHQSTQINSQMIENYLTSSINPLQLAASLKGGIKFSTLPVKEKVGRVAEKGLYFMQAEIYYSTVKFRRKNDHLRFEDADKAIFFYKQDLICDINRWESWWRMAQIFEEKLDDSLTWSADYLNNERERLVEFERKAILCYMAAASLVCYAEDSEELRKQLSEMWTSFGIRVYAASRSPMSMESFWTDDYPRYYSGLGDGETYTKPAHSELKKKQALQFSKTLFDRALRDGSGKWLNHYMLGKVIGKLAAEQYTKDGEPVEPPYKPMDSLKKYVDAIKLLPTREIIFEPHHKLISSSLKYVMDQKVDPAAAFKLVSEGSPTFSKGFTEVNDRNTYVSFALNFLRTLRAADKAKWHHRMTTRIARFYQDDFQETQEAYKEMATLFTQKGSMLSIWRPDYERPGRHFVFASNYTIFYAKLLGALNNRETLEGLTKRVRKNSSGLYQHQLVWDFVCKTYVKVLRRAGDIPPAHEDQVIKNVSYDDFTLYSGRLETHLLKPENHDTPLFVLLREIYELRRLSMGMGKYQDVEDLLNDTYAKIYLEYVPTVQKMVAQEAEVKANPMSVMNLVAEDPATDSSTTAMTPADGSTLVAKPKPTKVSKRDISSKISSLIKNFALVPAAKATSAAGDSARAEVQVVIPVRASGGTAASGPVAENSAAAAQIQAEEQNAQGRGGETEIQNKADILFSLAMDAGERRAAVGDDTPMASRSGSPEATEAEESMLVDQEDSRMSDGEGRDEDEEDEGDEDEDGDEVMRD